MHDRRRPRGSGEGQGTGRVERVVELERAGAVAPAPQAAQEAAGERVGGQHRVQDAGADGRDDDVGRDLLAVGQPHAGHAAAPGEDRVDVGVAAHAAARALDAAPRAASAIARRRRAGTASRGCGPGAAAASAKAPLPAADGGSPECWAEPASQAVGGGRPRRRRGRAPRPSRAAAHQLDAVTGARRAARASGSRSGGSGTSTVRARRSACGAVRPASSAQRPSGAGRARPRARRPSARRRGAARSRCRPRTGGPSRRRAPPRSGRPARARAREGGRGLRHRQEAGAVVVAEARAASSRSSTSRRPGCGACSSTVTSSPAAARCSAHTSPLWPAPTTTTRWPWADPGMTGSYPVPGARPRPASAFGFCPSAHGLFRLP